MKKLPHNFTLERYGLQVRLVEENDAEFIVALRTDPRLSQHIHATSTDVEQQKQWIRDYKLREEQGLDYYFIFSIDGQPQGLARICNITEEAFTHGSWVFSPEAVLGASILGTIITTEIGFELLEKKIEYFDVRKGNNTHSFVKSFHPEKIRTDELNIFYRLLPEEFNQGKKKHIALCMKTMESERKKEKLPPDFTLERYGLQVRLVEEDDAEFIVSLRTDPRLSKHIHATSPDVEQQKQWIRNYKLREEQGLDYYFLFSINGQPQGLARIYDITEDTFTQGSWIFSPEAVLGASVLGNIISNEIGFELLGKKIEYSDARKDNNTHRYVKTFHPEIVKTDELNIYYKILPEGFNQGKKKHITLCMDAMKNAKTISDHFHSDI